jgi:hypothetical protein
MIQKFMRILIAINLATFVVLFVRLGSPLGHFGRPALENFTANWWFLSTWRPNSLCPTNHELATAQGFHRFVARRSGMGDVALRSGNHCCGGADRICWVLVSALPQTLQPSKKCFTPTTFQEAGIAVQSWIARILGDNVRIGEGGSGGWPAFKVRVVG